MIALGIFWISVGLLLYTYLLFPLLLLLRGRLIHRPYAAADCTPELTVLVAACNEEAYIGACIDSLLAQDYPGDRMRIVIASDGSTDATEEVVRGYADRGVQLMAGPRRGKIETLNRTVPQLGGELIVFADAGTRFKSDALRELTRPFADASVGGVAGNQIYTREAKKSLTADGECAYWNLDRRLKEAQSRAGHVTSATGAIYAIRRRLFRTIPCGATDDFFVTTQVIAQGARLVYANEAQAFESVALETRTEFRRKTRIITQGLYALWVMRRLLNPFRYGFYSFQLAWQKFLRRLMVLPLLAILLVSPWIWSHGPLYQLAVIGQAVFYAAALIGPALQHISPGRSKLLTLPFFFCMVNLAALLAFIDTLRGKRIGAWSPTRGTETP